MTARGTPSSTRTPPWRNAIGRLYSQGKNEYNRWVWFKRRNKQRAASIPADARFYVDLDKDESIPLGDDLDPTSLMFTLSMRHGAIHVDHDSSGRSIVHVAGRTFTGSEDLSALRKARAEL